jgi:hypothetical protein
MRSINVRRVAAAAAGAAMIGSVLATGVAQVVKTPGDSDVASFVDSVKANLDGTVVVLGTEADISDGLAAARVAAALALNNYESTTASGTPTGATPGTVTVGAKSVTLETTGATAPAEGKTIALELANADANGALGASYLSQTITAYNGNSPLILTPTQLPNTLTSGTINALDQANTQRDYQWQERILVDSAVNLSAGQNLAKAQYYEDNNAAKIVLDIPSNGVIYNLHFLNGLDTPAAGVNYTGVPEVTFLGQKYGIDSATLTTSRVDLYSGTSVSKFVGEAHTAGDYTVSLDSVASDGSAAYVTVKKGDTVVTSGDRIVTRSGKDYDSNKVTVYIESAAKVISAENVETGRSTMRVGTGKISLLTGNTFPLDDTYSVNIISAGNRINDISLLSRQARSGISGSNLGIDIGSAISGPKATSGATSGYFSVNFVGPKAPIVQELVRLNGDGTRISSVAWQNQDGITETLNYDNTYYNPAAATGWNGLNMSAGQYAVVTDRVIKMTSLYNKSGVGMVYSASYGGTTLSDIAAGTQFSFGQAGLYTTCQFDYVGIVNNIYLANLTCNRGGAIAPGAGIAAELANIQGMQQPLGTNVASINAAAAWAPAPMVSIMRRSVAAGGAFNNLNISYDNVSTYKGFYVNMVNATNVSQVLATGIVATNSSVQYPNNDRQIMADGTDITGSTSQLDVIVPGGTGDDRRKSLVNVQTASVAANGSTTVVTEDKLPYTVASGIKIKAIDVATTTTEGTAGTCDISGTYFAPVSKPITDVKKLVVMDKDVGAAAYQIVIGGPWVNSVAKGMTNANLITARDAKYLIVESNKLLVAGYGATDTMEAAEELIGMLTA